MYESNNEFIVHCNDDKCLYICPKCNDEIVIPVETNPGDTVHCCKNSSDCFRVKDVSN